MRFKRWLENWLYQPPKIDLRQEKCDEVAKIADGTLYRKGKTVQVWWVRDGRGEPFEQPVAETWTYPDDSQAAAAFQRNLDGAGGI